MVRDGAEADENADAIWPIVAWEKAREKGTGTGKGDMHVFCHYSPPKTGMSPFLGGRPVRLVSQRRPEGRFMRNKSPRRASLAEYIAEILKNAVYEKGEQLEVWLMSGLRSGEDPPVVNGCRLAITAAPRRPGNAPSQPRIKA